MLGKPKDPRPMPTGEEDDSYLKPGMKDENESGHKIGTMPVAKPKKAIGDLVRKLPTPKGKIAPMPKPRIKSDDARGMKPYISKVNANKAALRKMLKKEGSIRSK